MGLVVTVANRFEGRGMEREDLIQWGSIGLLKAARSFDPALGTAFSTYAFSMIAGELKNALRSASAVKAGRRLRELKARIDRLVNERTGEGRPLRTCEIAELLHEDERDIAEALGLSLPPLCLDAPVTGEGLTLADTLQDPKSTEDEALSRILFTELLEGLTERERLLIRLRFIEGESQLSAANALGVSQSRVSRMEKELLINLRRGFKTE